MTATPSMLSKFKRSINNILGRYPEARRYQQLFDLIRARHPKTIMEIGTWYAGRAAAMISLAKAMSPREQIAYYGFDMWEDLTAELYAQEISKHPPTMAEVRAKLTPLGARVELFKGDTNKILPATVDQLPPMDFIYIDGGHSNETIANDWRYSSSVLAPGGVVVFDDYWPDRTDAGAKQTVDAISRDQYKVTIMPIVDIFKNPDHGRLVIQFAMVERLQK